MVKKILCINGGGIRGIVAAQFLKRLEENLSESLYNTFDMFAGTSTGSLIVSAISYQKMTAEKIVDELYSPKNCQKIMKKSIWDKILGPVQTVPEYTNEGLKELIDFYIPHKPRINDTQKETLITSFDVDNYKPIFFKSFKNKRNILLKDALCMSSAAPCYFPTYHNQEINIWGIDGGVFANCVSDCAYAEALKIYGKDEDIRVLSIGTGFNYQTGIGKESENFGGIEWVVKGDLIDLFFQAPQLAVDYKMKTFTEALGHKYLHIDSQTKYSKMDDTTNENIKNLKDLGDKWWEEHRKEIIKFLIS